MENLIAAMKLNNIAFNQDTLEKIYHYACQLYGDSMRYNNQKVIDHATGVAIEVAELRLDENSVYASMLHEAYKYDVDPSKLEELFGTDIVNLVKGIHKISYLNYSNIDKLDITMLRKMFMAIAKDIRVILIKLVDRLYNMRNIKEIPHQYQITKAKETLEIYSPIAHRLGISPIKSELEDISFRILMPKEYADIKSKIDFKKEQRECYIKERMQEINEKLGQEVVNANVYGRPKHFYSIYKKIKEKDCDVYDIFDLLAIRIIVDSVKDCYTALGIVHAMYKPMPGRFKDYIAVPKTNNYQSLHTTVFGENGIPFEVQIRTWDMQRFAEYGAAAHFMYKEKSTELNETEQKILWIRQTMELQKELTEDITNLNSFKGELFGEEVFVFTPKGEIKALPRGATIIDFAYSVHQNIAEKMVGAKINGKLMPIFSTLSNTDVVQILTSKNSQGPSLDWLKHVSTNSARNKITSYLKKQGLEDYISRGKELFEKEVGKQKIPKQELLKEEYLEEMITLLKRKDLNNVYENIGFGTLSYIKVVNKLKEVYNKHTIKQDLTNKSSKRGVKKSSDDAVIVEDLDNCLIKFARCCNPIPGDEIIGYITFSNGISIHRTDCSNLNALDTENRKIKVGWKEKLKSNFTVTIQIFSNYRDNITIDIIRKTQDLKLEVVSLNTHKNENKEYMMELCLITENMEALNKIIRELKRIDSVYEVKRKR